MYTFKRILNIKMLKAYVLLQQKTLYKIKILKS